MPSARDWLVAVVAAGVDIALFSQLSDDPDRYGWAGTGIPAAVIIEAGAVAVPLLAFRRRAPVAVSLILSGYSILCTVVIGTRPLLTLLVALYTAAAWSSRRRALQCLAATLAANAVSTAYEATLSGPGPRPFAVVAVATVFVLLDLATWAAGRRSSAARQRAEYLEASRAALAAEAVKAERQRIARELHDIVAHSISLIAIQAAGAARVMDRDPARATQSMDSIGRLSQQAINELRRMLTLIEETGSGPLETESAGSGEIPDLLPGVRQLIAQVGDSGHEVALVVTGTPTELDPSIRLAAHRIAQESLTNAVKHGEPAARIELAVGWTPNQLSLRISNHVTGARPSETRQLSTGRGLYGLQERARLVGGHLDAGSDQDRFIVAATLPTSVSEALEVS
ncbi:sensor histidine kinase [Kribbella sp. VKM Ac-2568]|uniref:sensor histidine kinase n=1 Tax=Kribbella sp. VKM Ac-2568 TaxID=2512219 RepID=UPI0010EC11C9|nr:histidine kinase [Kribbella sp. VKM Ac-2568]TCM38926.1 signal transduction histidine kinase [Kribbella sp. VKM Ac-2568]